MAQRILITGGSSLLAVNWAISMREQAVIHLGQHKRNVAIKSVQTVDVPITNAKGFYSAVDKIEPDVIIHTAGITNIEDCEANPDLANAINNEAAGMVAQIAAERSIRLIHISTDHLFDGKTPMLDEAAVPSPVNVYGRSKLAGERKVQSVNPDALILRVNFFGWGPAYRLSLSDWIITSLENNQNITLFENVMFTPLYTDELIKLAHAFNDQKASGIYHATCSTRISKYEFGMALANSFNLDDSLITKGKYNPENGVPRPLDMSLDNRKMLEFLNLNELLLESSIDQLANGISRQTELKKIEQSLPIERKE